MALYIIEWKKSAVKELKKLDKKIISRIINAVEVLSENPVPANCKKLIGSDHIYRIRIGHRKDIYKKHK